MAINANFIDLLFNTYQLRSRFLFKKRVNPIIIHEKKIKLNFILIIELSHYIHNMISDGRTNKDKLRINVVVKEFYICVFES